MNAHEAIRGALNTSQFLLNMYVGDMSDEDLMTRVCPKANHAAWQMGHLIASENKILESIQPGSSPTLPDGFMEKHNKDAALIDDKANFVSKEVYLELFKEQREATLAVLDSLSAEDLSKPGPENLKRIAPTVGSALMFMAIHELTHSGQFVPLRRKLDKPVLI